MNTLWKSITAAGLALTITGAARADDTLARVKSGEVLHVAINNQYPFAFTDSSGELTGFSVETLREFLAQTGKSKLDPVVLDWASMIPALKAKRVDMVLAGMFIKSSRCEQASFSNPDYQSFDTLVVPKGNPENIHSLDDVKKNPDMKIAALQGGSSAMTLNKAGLPESQEMILPGYVEMFAALKAKRVNAVMIDTVSAGKFLASDTQSIERAHPYQVPLVNGKPVISYGSFVFRKEDKGLVDQFNQFLATWVGSPKQIALFQKYGLSADDVPPKGLTADQICAAK